MFDFVPPEINQPRPGRILLVGRDPGENEMESGRPFVGKAGQLLDELLAEGGLRRSEVNITNVVPVQPAGNDFNAHEERNVEQGIRDLHRLVAELKPSLIVTLGNEAAYSLVDGWPSRGRGIYGAKDITERRGYFWSAGDKGEVLTTLHPSGILRKQVPGRFLAAKDFSRARAFVGGHLAIEVPPPTRRLSSYSIVTQLVSSQLLAWDIETKWDMNSLLWCGFCGDDLQPYAASYPYEFRMYGIPVLTNPVRKVGHNVKFDVSTTDTIEGIRVVGVDDDTQQMWWALEPELAGDDDAGGDETEETRHGKRMTRKGLAFLMSIMHNVRWWKNYPPPDDPQHDHKMFILNGIDTWSTRILAGELMDRMQKENVIGQYRQAMDAMPALLDMHLEGLPINDKLRQERIKILDERKDTGSMITRAVALDYIIENEVPAFRKMKKCPCCGGGKSQALHCMRCSGYENGNVKELAKAQGITQKKFKESLGNCVTCAATGKVAEYHFNPFSPPQMKKLLHDVIGIPKHTFKGKDMMDEDAMKKILRWAKT